MGEVKPLSSHSRPSRKTINNALGSISLTLVRCCVVVVEKESKRGGEGEREGEKEREREREREIEKTHKMTSVE